MPDQNLIKNLISPNYIYVKVNSNNTHNDKFFKKNDVIRVDSIELETDNKNILGTFINVNSYVRGTGWYNESITHSLPILICNNKTEKLFKGTFPLYPYLKIEKNISNEFFYSSLNQLRKFNNINYIDNHNDKFKKNFLNCIDRI